MLASYLDTAMGFLEPLLTDDLVEIAINPDGRIWKERRGDSFMTPADVEATPSQIEALAQQIANEAEIRVSEAKPVFSVSIRYGVWLIRAQILQSPAVSQGVAIALRFYNPDVEIYEPRFLHGKPMSASALRRERNREMRDLATKGQLVEALRFCVTHKLNVIVSGGTSSGKTMVARYLQKMIGDEERIVTIEDAPDLLPSQPNKVMMVSLTDDPYRSPDRLLQASLRMRPDRIILSEVRGKEAYTFLKAINTGHGGSITTLHADTAELAISRLAQAALEGSPGMTFREMTDYIGQSIDVIVHQEKQGGARGVTEIYLPGIDWKGTDE